MLKNWKTYLLVSVLLALCVFVVWSSYAFQHCIQESEGYAGGQTIKERATNILPLLNTYRGCTGEFLHKNAEAITGLFTLILAISTILLWRVTRAAADAAKAAAEYIPTVEGAHVYVVIKEDRIQNRLRTIGSPGLSPDFTLRIQVALKNFGKTPAFIERFSARISLISTKKPISGPEAGIQPNTIIGNGDESLPLVVSVPRLSKTDAEEIRRASAALILGGTLVYRDILGQEWTVPFDGRFDNEADSFRIDNQPRQKNT